MSTKNKKASKPWQAETALQEKDPLPNYDSAILCIRAKTGGRETLFARLKELVERAAGEEASGWIGGQDDCDYDIEMYEAADEANDDHPFKGSTVGCSLADYVSWADKGRNSGVSSGDMFNWLYNLRLEAVRAVYAHPELSGLLEAALEGLPKSEVEWITKTAAEYPIA